MFCRIVTERCHRIYSLNSSKELLGALVHFIPLTDPGSAAIYDGFSGQSVISDIPTHFFPKLHLQFSVHVSKFLALKLCPLHSKHLVCACRMAEQINKCLRKLMNKKNTGPMFRRVYRLSKTHSKCEQNTIKCISSILIFFSKSSNSFLL